MNAKRTTYRLLTLYEGEFALVERFDIISDWYRFKVWRELLRGKL